MKQSLTELLGKKMEGWNKKTQGLNPMLEKESKRMWHQCKRAFWVEK